jgi:hypothetical protein
VDIYKVQDPTTANLEGFTVLGCNDTIAAVSGIEIERGLDCTLTDVVSREAVYAGVSLTQCYGTTLNQCRLSENFANDFGGDYALLVGNSSYTTVNGGRMVAARHATAIGGGSDVGDVPCRFTRFNGVHITTSGNNAQAGDIHGNAEFTTYENCLLDGGTTIGGDHSRFINNTLRGDMVNGPSLMLSGDIVGGNHEIIGNKFEALEISSDRGVFIDFGGNSTTISSTITKRGGTIKVEGNHFIRAGDPGAQPAGCVFFNRGYDGTDPINISFKGNTSEVVGTSDPNRLLELLCQVRAIGGGKWGTVNISDNEGDGGFETLTSGLTPVANRIVCKDNTLKRGRDFMITDASDAMVVTGNVLDDFSETFGVMGVSDGSRCKFVDVSDNTLNNINWKRQPSGALEAALIMWNADRARVKDNFVVETFKDIRVEATSNAGGFTVGEVVTGGTSGATATVYATRDPHLSVRDSISGTFVAGETITGGSSAYTAVLEISPVRSINTYWASFYYTTDLWRDHNIDTEGRGVLSFSITNDNTII